METTRDKILKTTFLLMLEKGYDKILVSDIQSELGISRGLLYRYFKSKSDLIFSACREYFYDRHFAVDIDYSKLTLRQFLDYAELALAKIVDLNGQNVEILKYNTLYSSLIHINGKFTLVALEEFSKARLVIHNAIKRGEIKELPENFVGATILGILGRTSYITETPSNEYVFKRIIEDVNTFYNLIKK